MPELKSSPQYPPHNQRLAWFWAKREEERRRRREKETRRRGDREMIGRLVDMAMFDGIFDFRFSMVDGRFFLDFIVLTILK